LENSIVEGWETKIMMKAIFWLQIILAEIKCYKWRKCNIKNSFLTGRPERFYSNEFSG